MKKNLNEGRFDTGEKFKPTVQWMSERYTKANKELFDGMLGDCIFLVEPIKSHTSWLGMFKMNPARFNYTTTGVHLYADGYTRRLYLENSWGEKTYITYDNFYELAKPTITMNSYYSGTEESLYATLVHEMCHYYTYMRGYCPKQAHGVEFRSIGAAVAYRSNGELTIQRIASAEQMTGYELDDEIKQEKERRQERKRQSAHYYIVLRPDGQVRLCNPSGANVVENILFYEKQTNGSKVLEVVDPDLTNELFDSGFKKKQRTYRFWGEPAGISKWHHTIKKILNNPNTYKIILDNE